MSRIVAQMELTLDGYMTGPNGEMDWFSLDPDVWQLRVSKYESIGTVLLGRRNYEGFAGFWPLMATNPAASPTDVTFSRWLDAVPKVVFSHTLQGAPWQNSRLAEGDLAGELAKLKQQNGKDVLIMSSASLIQQGQHLGLLDELWLNVHPVTLGEGRRLFTERMNLELLESRVFDSGQVFLHYAVRR
ncbi:dihydrofolate reductase (plasmid) [Deinococcus metallilatus]|uniref:Dihydrofolate reductase n=1 Tax=Deinococcus metallilatus TaxID=1211322 RepID=A0AAJ5JZY6_9DEIO|nr:dihydrofolate reductase family protein [Deinococcus metallilatus]MBB5295712.1 dihydrofolate reductase [Deinococcus metallilatus]QBY06840.1 dihydrofolate reductase [Deinococcus metallilatus]TLK32229.1 dihydrofolate reductase [Deinococcus metallilatus]GMA14243.1 deaminase [Deinococcus metallilatus]